MITIEKRTISEDHESAIWIDGSDYHRNSYRIDARTFEKYAKLEAPQRSAHENWDCLNDCRYCDESGKRVNHSLDGTVYWRTDSDIEYFIFKFFVDEIQAYGELKIHAQKAGEFAAKHHSLPTGYLTYDGNEGRVEGWFCSGDSKIVAIGRRGEAPKMELRYTTKSECSYKYHYKEEVL